MSCRKKILITGGAGNVGGALARHLVQRDYDVTIVDNLSTGSRWKLPDADATNWKFIKADVNDYHDLSAIMCSMTYDYVFHYAAVVGVQRTLQSPIAVLSDIEGIRNLLMLAKNTGVQRVFFSSSSEVYGEPVELPQHEQTTPLNSRLPYAIVKNVGEAYLRSFKQEHDLDYTIFRFFNTYGPMQSEDFVITKFIKQALSHSPITIYGDGSQTRTFCYVDDNVAACTQIFESNLYVNDVVNIGSDVEVTILELAKLVIAELGSRSEIVHLPALSEGDMARRCPDIQRMKAVLRHTPISLVEGVRRTAGYLTKNCELLALARH